MKSFCAIAAALILASCVQTNSIPLAANVSQITASAPPACNQISAQNVAIKRAAAETIRRGFDYFLVAAADASDSVRVIGNTPITSNTQGQVSVFGNTAYAQSSTTYGGGYPIFSGTRDFSLVIYMFRDGEPATANAINARSFLGEDWEELAQKENFAC